MSRSGAGNVPGEPGTSLHTKAQGLFQGIMAFCQGVTQSWWGESPNKTGTTFTSKIITVINGLKYTIYKKYICFLQFQRPPGTPVSEQVEFIFVTHCKKAECMPWGRGVGSPWRRHLSKSLLEKSPMGFGLWLAHLREGVRKPKFVLGWYC